MIRSEKYKLIKNLVRRYAKSQKAILILILKTKISIFSGKFHMLLFFFMYFSLSKFLHTMVFIQILISKNKFRRKGNFY